jgi:hypothetical protein
MISSYWRYDINPKSRMRGPHVRFCESCGGVIRRSYSTPTGVMPHIGGQIHAAINIGKLSKYV